MGADLVDIAFALALLVWTCVLLDAVRRVDSRLRALTDFRAAALLLETRRNG